MGDERVAVVVAHPDDETVGFGARLPTWRPAALVVLTDGAPRDPWFARHAGFADREAYARARRQELEAALEVIRFDVDRLHLLDVPDQEATLQLPMLIDRVTKLLVDAGATLVATHAYEGGHPDHDAAAFVVHRAVARLARPARIVEAPYYHDALGDTVYGRFVAREDAGDVDEHRLGPDELAAKRAMLAAYGSQRDVLARFDATVERVRPAPRYDFTKPPHPGRLHYERWGWPLDGATFRARVAEARSLAPPSSVG